MEKGEMGGGVTGESLLHRGRGSETGQALLLHVGTCTSLSWTNARSLA
jgi:hypothetical protein